MQIKGIMVLPIQKSLLMDIINNTNLSDGQIMRAAECAQAKEFIDGLAGGLDYVAAFSLSDLYLQRLGRVSSRAELSGILSEVLVHFARKVREAQELQRRKVSSPYIRRGIQYIRSHLHGRIALEDVAQEVGLDPKYFSRLFVSVTGERFSAYVQRERIQEAKDLLANSGRTIIDVSNSLGFSSQSYFIKVFSEVVGETPGEYLKKHRVPRG